MNLLHRTGTLILLLVYLAGSVGLSVTHHLCSAGHKTEIVQIEGVNVAGTGTQCCCHEQEHNETAERPFCGDLSFTATPCCSEVTEYLRLEIVSHHPGNLISNIPVPDWFTLPVLVPALSDLSGENFRIPDIPANPPPHDGTNRVYLFHQIKIPTS
jgi:hypothetical protein